MATMGRLLEGRELGSVEEVNAFLHEVMDQHGGRLPTVAPQTPLEQAQALIYQALETSGPERLGLARQALTISPDCADAYILLAEATSDPSEGALVPRPALAAHAGRAACAIQRRVRSTGDTVDRRVDRPGASRTPPLRPGPPSETGGFLGTPGSWQARIWTWRRDRRSAGREGKRTSAGLGRECRLAVGHEKSRQSRVVAHRGSPVKPLDGPHPLAHAVACSGVPGGTAIQSGIRWEVTAVSSGSQRPVLSTLGARAHYRAARESAAAGRSGHEVQLIVGWPRHTTVARRTDGAAAHRRARGGGAVLGSTGLRLCAGRVEAITLRTDRMPAPSVSRDDNLKSRLSKGVFRHESLVDAPGY
jgi:hypothetical protein